MRKTAQETIRRRRRKRALLLTSSVAFIIFGFWIGGTNTYSFLKGTLLLQTDQVTTGDLAVNKENTIKEERPRKQKPEPLYPERPSKGENIGNLVIPKLEATLPIYHGTEEEELEQGVGHFADSVLPGEKDNSVLSGHRDTIFRELGEVEKGDLLIVETSAGVFTYKVKHTRIVPKDELTVIVPKPKATLTVSTCYPFYFVGPSPERFILIADLIKSEIHQEKVAQVNSTNQ